MAEYDPTNFSKSPYFDDYDETKKFLRILFKPGRAVQARELTQLQSISQNQITRLGSHFFQEGSQLFDGQFADIKCKFLRVEKQHDSTDINPDAFLNQTISLLGSDESQIDGEKIANPLRAKVLHIEAPTDADPYHVFFIQYEESQYVSGSDDEVTEYTNDNVLTKIDYNEVGEVINTQYRCVVKKTSVDEWKQEVYTTGDSVLVSNDEGIFYVEGYFVLAPKQIIPLYKTARTLSDVLDTDLDDGANAIEIENTTPPGSYPSEYGNAGTNYVQYYSGDGLINQELIGIRLFQYPTAKVGFALDRQAVESIEDVTLLDNAFGSYNYSAPGGDRYKIDLALTQIAFPNTVDDAKLEEYVTDKFLEKMRIIDGVVSHIEKYPTYTDFEDTLARRTYDESGNYTVRPFDAEVREYFRDDRYVIMRSTPTNGSVATAYNRNDIVYGGTTGNYWYGVVVHDDVFLDRMYERTFVGYGTTVIYVISGTPTPGDEMHLDGVEEDSEFAKNSTIITEAVLLSESATDIALPCGCDYTTLFSPVQLDSDWKNGLYPLSRLALPIDDEVLDNLDDAKNKLAIGMGAGKAYVFGYEFENQSVEYLTAHKSRDIKTNTDEQIVHGIGNYIVCNALVAGDSGVSGTAGPLLSPDDNAFVELWGPTGGWETDNGELIHSDDDQIDRKGIARIKTVNYNFAVSNTVEDKTAQVYLYDISLDQGKKFKDISRIYLAATGADIESFKVNTDVGVEEVYGSDTNGAVVVIGGSTILYDPKSNSSVFCVPTTNSIKTINSLNTYEVTKAFKGCYFDQTSFNDVMYLRHPNENFQSIGQPWLNTPMYKGYNDNYRLHWSGASQTVIGNPAFDIGEPTTMAAACYIDSADDINKTRYALINELNGDIIDITDVNNFILANKHGASHNLMLWSKDETLVQSNAGGGPTYTLVAAIERKAPSDPVGPIPEEYDDSYHIKKKELMSMGELVNDIDYAPYFSDGLPVSDGEDGAEGYYKLTLSNALIDAVYDVDVDHVQGHNYAATWGEWTQGAGPLGDFTPTSLPRLYTTSLGFSDVYEVTEVLAWYHGDDANGNPMGVNDVSILKDITEEFEFAPATSDNLYDHSKIIINQDQLKALRVNGYFTKHEVIGSFLPWEQTFNCTLFVKFKFFEHSGAGPIVVNSYNHNDHHPSFGGYDSIPVHTSPLYGSRMELRNCLDFRPKRNNVTSETIALANDTYDPLVLDELCPIRDNWDVAGGNETEAFDSAVSLLKPKSIVSNKVNFPELSYDIYLGKFAKLVLRKSREFDIIYGKSASVPEMPEDDSEAMTLYSLVIPEYTYNSDDVVMTYIDHQRFTMEDIAKLEKRIEKIEYYTSLNLLEKETAELSIIDPVIGTERIKNGILCDNFKGHAIGDVLNRDYTCAIDFEKGELRPKFIAHSFPITQEQEEPNVDCVESKDGIITLRYNGDEKEGETEGVAVAKPPRWFVQPVASHSVSVNPFNVTNWLGSLKLSPSSDTWKDTTRKPTIKVNLEGENDAWEAMGSKAAGTQWNDWETTWTGSKIKSQSSKTKTTRKYLESPHTNMRPDGRLKNRVSEKTTTVSKQTPTVDKKQTRSGIKPSIIPERVTKNVDERVVDTSIVPFVRKRTITVNAEGLKPSTRVFAFFDDVLVDEYCTPKNPLSGEVQYPGAPIFSDKTGKVVDLIFELPAGKFKTGEREFRLTDTIANDVVRSQTSAEATYFAQGLLQSKKSSIVSTRVPVLRRQSVQESKVVKDVLSRTKTTDKNTKAQWVDPLGQTFTVGKQENPKGVWVQSVDLFFSHKPTSDIPVKLQIRPTVNGYPHSSVVLPFAEVSVDRVNVKTTLALTESSVPSPDNSDTYTRFKFSSPVYLIPDEYALVLLSNSDEYECYVAEMGKQRVGLSTERITKQPATGMFFKSQNAGKWDSDKNIDLMFAINKCKFVKAEVPKTIKFSTDKIAELPENEVIKVDTIRIVSENVKLKETPLKVVGAPLSKLAEATGIEKPEIPFNENVKLEKAVTIKNVDGGADSLSLDIEIGTEIDAVSPVLDTDRLSLVVIQNIVTSANETGLEEDETAPFVPPTPEAEKRTRYISRRVELDEGVECDDFKVSLKAHRPALNIDGEAEVKTEVKVWLRAQKVGDNTPFEELPWMLMENEPSQLNHYTTTDEEEFAEYEFLVPKDRIDYETGGPRISTGYNPETQMFDEPISRYNFKITLHSEDSSVVPIVKDLKTIAVT